MSEIGKVREVKFNLQQNNVQMSDVKGETYSFFEAGNVLQGDTLVVQGKKSDWTTTLTTEYNKLGLNSYTWTQINGVDDAVAKSENNFIDLIRYYEGHGTNYEAKINYKDTVSVSTYGYGLTATAMKAIGNYDDKNKKVINKPDTQAKAYEQLLKYLNNVTLPETKTYLGDIKYDELPQGIKAALLDYHFKNGYKIMSESSLKSKLQTAKKTDTAADWAAVLKELVYTFPASSKAEKKDNPGLHRRSLSRVILAAKDLKKKFKSAEDKAIIDKAVKEIYDAGVKCAKDNNIGTTDFDRIYNSYAETSAPAQVKTPTIVISNPSQSKYKVPSQMGLFSAANAMIPDNAAIKNGIDAIELRKAVINKIIQLNNISTDGTDANGYPKVRLLEQGEELVIPASVEIGGKTIQLKAPEEWEIVSQPNKQTQVPESDNETEAGNYIVKSGDTWWSIARAVATDDYTEHQINTLQQQIADYNNNIELHPGIIIKIPAENYVDPAEGKSGELGITESNFAKMLKNIPNKSKKIGKSDIEELTFEYSLQQGDSIYRIALNYGIEYKELLKDNGISEKNASNLAIGTKIKIKKFAYTAQSNETIEAIANKYGLSKDLLLMVNGNITNVKKGEKIEIPGFVYTVVKNDTWSKIAQNNSVTIDQLQKINGKNLSKGQQVFIPQGISAVENVNADMPITHLSSSVKQNVETSLSNLGNRKYLKPKNVVYDSNGKVQCLRVEIGPTGSGKLNGKTILVNAGHGLKRNGSLDQGNPGIGSSTLPPEWLVAYDNAERLIERLTKQGASVILISGNEKPEHLMRDEIGRDRNKKANMLISIHTNSSDNPPAKDRAEIYYSSSAAKGKKLAELFESKLDDYQNDKNYAQPKQVGMNVLVKAENKGIPGILWEIAFQNTKSGCNKLANTALMDKYSDMLVESVVAYFNTPDDTSPRYTVQKGDSLGKIAKKYHTTITELQKLNGLKGTSIRVGQRLKVPGKSNTNNSAVSGTSSTSGTKQVSSTQYIIHKVKKGETLSKIANKYGVTVEQIKKLNGLKNNNIKQGQQLKIKKK